jgi:hypothetical protein
MTLGASSIASLPQERVDVSQIGSVVLCRTSKSGATQPKESNPFRHTVGLKK